MTQIAKKNALVIGSHGTIGKAITKELADNFNVFTLSQTDTDYSSESLAQQQTKLAAHGAFHRIICCIGVLHNGALRPEKSLTQIDADKLAAYFRINSILPMLCLQSFIPLLAKPDPAQPNANAVFACLSAMVGSIEENQLGGWYGYRSSKAALNMLIKTTAIEVRRKNKNAIIAAIHPGTTIGNLSDPFKKNINKQKYYSPDCSASRICDVMDKLTEKQSGDFFNWDGSRIAW
ncbi:SDR family NAD(P)-dependent oxidoreductase [bacterium]|nr:SDR family NAD(P)-dependent oxidoreductase [bacterium]